MPVPDPIDPYAKLAELYDLEHDAFTDDIDFILRVAVIGPVLEIGSGTGRLMQPLLSAGLEVWGVEQSAPMLDRARERLTEHPAAHFVLGSVLNLNLDRRFSTCIFPLNVLWHLPTAEEQVGALRKAAAHLEAGGVLVIDTSNPITLADRRSNGELRERFRSRNEEGTTTCDSSCWDNEAEQTLQLNLRYDSTDVSGAVHRLQTDLVLRYVYASELHMMLCMAGFRRCSWFGSYDEEEYVSESPSLIAIAVRD